MLKGDEFQILEFIILFLAVCRPKFVKFGKVYGSLVVSNAVFRLSTTRFVTQTFAIRLSLKVVAKTTRSRQLHFGGVPSKF